MLAWITVVRGLGAWVGIFRLEIASISWVKCLPYDQLVSIVVLRYELPLSLSQLKSNVYM